MAGARGLDRPRTGQPAEPEHRRAPGVMRAGRVGDPPVVGVSGPSVDWERVDATLELVTGTRIGSELSARAPSEQQVMAAPPTAPGAVTAPGASSPAQPINSDAAAAAPAVAPDPAVVAT